MNFNEYQDLAGRTANKSLELKTRAAVAGLGLAGETGEAVELLKKWIGHGHLLETEVFQKELGDVLWYVAELANVLGLDLQEVAQENIEKLKRRYPEGFSSADSQARVDVTPRSVEIRRVEL
jgi:NTP pyrophosphatase (non-canonical NTP hydrolase)